MVDSVLAFARGLAVSEPLEVCELGKFLEQLRADMLDRFDLHPGVTTEVGLRPNAMRRALRNVIENALRYGGWARVGYGIDGKNALITVVDSGPGIPEEDLERVFDPFLRLEASRSLETGGYGLGLSIARTIARAHAGGWQITGMGRRACAGQALRWRIAREPHHTDRSGHRRGSRACDPQDIQPCHYFAFRDR